MGSQCQTTHKTTHQLIKLSIPSMKVAALLLVLSLAHSAHSQSQTEAVKTGRQFIPPRVFTCTGANCRQQPVAVTCFGGTCRPNGNGNIFTGFPGNGNGSPGGDGRRRPIQRLTNFIGNVIGNFLGGVGQGLKDLGEIMEFVEETQFVEENRPKK